ncbi:MAG: response regulator transcription factor [Armatimonadetes bacterium]|nr:response regulator transcription factor [Armatimonadota bacterium]
MATTIPVGYGRERGLDTARVLVVDSHPVVGGVVAEALAAAGYHAIHCTSPDEALRWCRLGGVDALLIEVGLHTSDGRRLASLLSEEFPDLPVAVLTAWLDHPETRYIDRRGTRLVLHKPLQVDRLELAVRALLDGFRSN